MSPEGYAAFVAWCTVHNVEPCGPEQWEGWTTQRLHRYMRTQFRKRDSGKVEAPTLW